MFLNDPESKTADPKPATFETGNCTAISYTPPVVDIDPTQSKPGSVTATIVKGANDTVTCDMDNAKCTLS